MVSIHLDYFDEVTEQTIVAARTGVTLDDARKIVGILRSFRHMVESYQAISIRPAIIIGKTLRQQGIHAEQHNPLFVDICVDALISGRHNTNDRVKMTKLVTGLIHSHGQDESATNFADTIDTETIEKLVAAAETKQPDKKMVKRGGSK
jgi:hypothetical protein